jgi:A/G-specific adenine glycosylase
LNTPEIKLDPFSERLLRWWDEHGRYDLPWQKTRTPYRVWVSEIMLQQTQVTTVIPYFERWMKQFPDLHTLAVAPLDDVLAHWAGLGYYARARNLHRAAALCMEQHAGELPLGADDLSALPGIGLSTANAIISQSTDRPAAVLDGNVRRSLARHLALEGWTGKADVQKTLWAEAKARLPEQRGADYTQAIMDLGAMVCTRSNPDCPSCPVSGDCRAFNTGQVHKFPVPKPATKVTPRNFCMLIIRDDAGRVLLVKRPPSGIWGGLWSLPMGETIDDIGAELGLAEIHSKPLATVEHRLSHIHMSIHPALATSIDASHVKCSSEQIWLDPSDRASIGLPKPVSELLNRINNGDIQ